MAEGCTLGVWVATEVRDLVAAELVVLSVYEDASPSSCVHREPLRSWNGKAVSSGWSCGTRRAGLVRGMSCWEDSGDGSYWKIAARARLR